jgi:5-methylcytosine-specific restriction endonuclease McrA
MEDGREILSPADWSKRRKQVWERAWYYCEGGCGRITDLADGEAHHKIKRGMGGGFRDDRLENLEWLCRECHRIEEASGNRTKMSGQ